MRQINISGSEHRQDHAPGGMQGASRFQALVAATREEQFNKILEEGSKEFQVIARFCSQRTIRIVLHTALTLAAPLRRTG